MAVSLSTFGEKFGDAATAEIASLAPDKQVEVHGVPVGGRRSGTEKTVTLTIMGDDSKKLVIPVHVCSKVSEVRRYLSSLLYVREDILQFAAKNGSYWKIQGDTEEIRSQVKVKGIKSFKPEPKVWPHPVCIIGAGYHGLKTAMTYIRDKNFNIIEFDRNDRVGGYCWITGANDTSKLQTEFGAFHLWWGPEFAQVEGKCGDGYYDLQKWSIWPKKKEILEHFQYGAEQWGVQAYCQFRTNVSAMKIIGDSKEESRFYRLTVDHLDDPGKQSTVDVSVIYNYPGSLTTNRIINYPGEEQFGGEISYGMNNDANRDKMKGATMAILGNGAFAVENARTAVEQSCNKVYLVTRRKNLASPRIPCWFVHQAPFMIPGGMVLKMYEPAYHLCGFGDPWEFWSVHANKDRSFVSIVQSSRFGIGDVTFLAVAWGRLIYVQDTLKRCSPKTLHLTSGKKLEEVDMILKCLGLLGDWAVDALHSMKEIVGMWCAGDFRRPLMIDATGMNAANFETFSTGTGTHGFANTQKYLHDFPQVYYKAAQEGLMEALPRHKAEPEIEKPAYLTEVKHGMSGAITLGSFCPRAMEDVAPYLPRYWYEMYHKAHGFEKSMKQCMEEWDAYQERWWSEGHKHEYVPYPYTKEIVQGYFDMYNDLPYVKGAGWKIEIDGAYVAPHAPNGWRCKPYPD